MRLVSVHQPNFMPWCKLLGKVLASDVFVAYDSVQFTRKEFHARQRVRKASGQADWLTVPVISTGTRQTLAAVRVVQNTDWQDAHLNFLTTHYSNAPFFPEVIPLFSAVYERRHEFLVDHNIDLLETMCRYLASDVEIVRASRLPHAGTREERLLDLVRNAGGDAHLTSTSTTHVIDWSGFDQAGIPVFEQTFEHPVYGQGGDSFLPGLAATDLLFRQGRAAADILATCSGKVLRKSPDNALAHSAGE